MFFYLGVNYFSTLAEVFFLRVSGDCSQLTPLQLESLLTEGNTSRFWLVSLALLFWQLLFYICQLKYMNSLSSSTENHLLIIYALALQNSLNSSLI